MTPDDRFTGLPKHFWANIRIIGQEVGYTIPKKKMVRIPTLEEVEKAYSSLDLVTDHIASTDGSLTHFGTTLFDYFQFRADILNRYVEPRLMDAQRAKNVFKSLKKELQPTCPLPMNKQRGNKRSPAYLTGIVNMLVEAHSAGAQCDYDPRRLTTFTRNGTPVQTLARRVDGAFPSPIDPIAIWEIKEYYHTTTFGSRVADGVYETLLDGMELQELSQTESIDVDHLLIIDAHYTWWDCGRSYLCRIVDMLHMGYVDEVLFGYETVERLPDIVSNWIKRIE